MSIEATFDPSSHMADLESASFKQLGPDLALYLVADDNPIDPVENPEILPDGWRATGEAIPFAIRMAQDHWVYILERADE